MIPFSATILEGSLKINETSTRFLTTDSKPSPRNFTVVNEFKIPIAINNVSLLEKASKYFEVSRFAIDHLSSLSILTVLIVFRLKDSSR